MKKTTRKNYSSKNDQVSVNVGVGYGWMKAEEGDIYNGRAVLSDVFWNSLKEAFKPKHSAVDKTRAKVNFSRLRASQGKIIWMSILQRIKESDILIFDVAAAPENAVMTEKDFDLNEILSAMAKKKNVFNANVMIEIGAAIALDKYIMLLCPEVWRQLIPCDLKGYLWTFYKWGGRGKNSKRIFVDQYGMQNGYIGMLREAVNKKLGIDA